VTSTRSPVQQLLPLCILLLVLVLPTVPVSAQSTLGATSATRLGAPEQNFQVDRGPLDHLGYGNPEDLYVDLGAGAAVSLFSGNLVVSLRPMVRGDAVPDSQMALTYNHLDPEGSGSIAAGWSYDLGRRWVAGAWGDRVLIDGDGFQDSFLAAPLPDRRELLELADDVVRGWRRQTTAADRRAGGGERVFRQMIASDPMFFGEMRLQYLGRPKTDPRASYRSQRRGQRLLKLDDRNEHVVLTRHDGGSELYSKEGVLLQVEPAHGPVVKLIREGRFLTSVEVGGVGQYHLDHDSYGRMTRIRSTSGTSAQLQYVDRYLHRLQLESGSVEMSYDQRGRLVRLVGPEGTLEVTYDATSGRVSTARGPLGDVRLGDLVERADRLEVALAGTASGSWLGSWSVSRRERRIEANGAVETLRFEAERPLPVEWSSPAGSLFLEWTAAGQLESVRRGDDVVRWQRSESGVLEKVADVGGAEASMVRGDRGSLLGWVDPAGRRTRLSLDSFQLPSRMEAAGGAAVQIRRSLGGLLRQVDSAGHGSVNLRRDGRGLVRAVSSSTGAAARVQRDERGRITAFQSPGGLSLELSYGAGGRIEQLSDGHSKSVLRYSQDGVLLGWQGPWSETSIQRDSAGLLEGLRQGGVSRWSLRRDNEGQLRGVALGDGAERAVELHADGVPRAWQHLGGGVVKLNRDARGRVEGWSDELLGGGELSLDKWGRASQVRRGGGIWQLQRDRSGLAVGVIDPVGASTRLTLDPSGRVTLLSAPDQLTWHLEHDPLGRLIELRDGSQIWTLRHGRSGLPEVLADPRGRELRIDWDTSGRWRALRDGAGAVTEVAYGELGPTRVGDFRRVYGQSGELLSWGDGASEMYWRLARDESGLVSAVVLEDQKGAGSQQLADRRLRRDASGRVTRLGSWLLTWERGALAAVSEGTGRGDSLVQVARDSVGRATRLSNRAGTRAEVLRDRNGDVRELNLRQAAGGGMTWRLVRDSAGRVVGALQPGGLDWRLVRDPLGRVRQWQIGGIEQSFEVDFLPLDGTLPSVDQSLAVGLAVVERSADGAAKLSGSRRVEVQLPGSRPVLRFAEVRDARGALQAVTDVWEATLGSWEPGAALPADPIGEQIDASPRLRQEAGEGLPAVNLNWGAAPLQRAGRLLFPALDGSGAGVRGPGQVRLTTSDGMTVTWLGSGATLDGLQMPGVDGLAVSPGFWSAPVGAGSGAGDAEVAPDRLRGVAAGVAHWWGSLAVAEHGLARLPAGVAVASRAWRRPRQELLARAALLPPEQPLAGAGAGLPPVPGSARLVPGRAGSLLVSPLEALVLSGDLSPRAVEHESWLPVPTQSWSLEVPGAAVLRDLAERRAWPSVPPAWRRSELGGVSPHLAGFVTTAGCRSAASHGYELRPAVGGLPAGVVDVLPGRPQAADLGSASLPLHGRAAAVEALSDDPLAPGSMRRAQAASDAMLLFLRSVAALPDPAAQFVVSGRPAERWSIDLPSGLRLVVDSRGRLLSADVLGRLHRSWGNDAAARLGSALLSRGGVPEATAGLVSPPFLPAGLSLPEARWGLVPARADLALSSTLLSPALLRVTGSSPFPDAAALLPDPAPR